MISVENKKATFLKIFSGLIISATILSCNAVPVQAIKGEAPSLFDPTSDIVILHTNDTHGCVKADDSNGIIGFDTIKSIKDSLLGKVLLLDAGDMSNGQPFASKSNGSSPIKVMNAVGYDAAAIGNHEFDVPDDNIKKIIEQADFPLLSANIKHLSDGSYFSEPNVIFTVSDIKIGIFGLTTTEAAVNPITAAGLDFGTPESITNDAVEQAEILREQGCEIVILLSHLGIDPEHSSITSTEIAESLGGKVDVIIDGHSHSSPSSDQTVNGIPIVSTGAESDSNIGWVSFSKNSSGEYTADYGYIDHSLARDTYTGDPDISALIDELNQPVEQMATNKVAVIDADLNGERADIRTTETNLGNTVADAARTFTGADMAIMNSGAIRASLTKGSVTELDVYTVFPYGDSVYVSEVKGSVIKEALEHACSNYPAAEGTFAQVSGFSYSFNPDKPVGSRVESITINGSPIDENAFYKLATNNFWAIGGNGYTMLSEPFKTPLTYTKPQSSIYVMDIFIWYLNQTGGKTSDIENRIVILNSSESDIKGSESLKNNPDTGDRDVETNILILFLSFFIIAVVIRPSFGKRGRLLRFKK